MMHTELSFAHGWARGLLVNFQLF